MSALLAVFRAEIFKSLRKRRMLVLAGLWWVVLPALALVVGRLVHVNLGGSFADQEGTVQLAVQQIASPFGLTRINLMGPALVSPPFYIIVIALLAALFIGEERGHNMWKTVLVAQPGRLAVLVGKFAAAMALFGVLLAGALISGVLFGSVGTTFLPTDFSGAWAELIGLYAAQWAYAAGGMAFAFLMLFLLRNLALGVVTVFFLPPLLEALYALYRATVGFRPVNPVNALFQALQLRETLENLPRYFFTNNLYAPARSPLADILAGFGDPSPSDLGPLAGFLGTDITLPHAGAVMAGYFAVFALLLVLAFLRHDVS